MKKITSWIKKVAVWVWRSSSDPGKVSLTMRAGLTALITFATIWAGLAGIELPSELLTEWAEALISFVQSALIMISTAIAAYAAFRKLWTSLSGDNRVVNEHPVFTSEPR